MGRAPITMRTYQAGDETAFRPAPAFAAEAKAMGWMWRRDGAPGPTWTLLREGRVIGVGGFVLEHEHWDGWALLAAVERRDWPALMTHADMLMTALHALDARPVLAWIRNELGALCCARRLRFERLFAIEDRNGGYVRAIRRSRRTRVNAAADLEGTPWTR